MPDSHVVDHAMHFGSALRGTRSFWNKRRVELCDMITQLGIPTFFFTLSAADTKWHDLHMLMPSQPPTSLPSQFQWRIHNIITNPHTTSLYMHHRFTIFLEEVLLHTFNTKDYWCRFVLLALCILFCSTCSHFEIYLDFVFCFWFPS